MPNHTIDLRQPPEVVYSGHLGQGGVDPRGNRLDANNHYLTLNGRPFFGVSGEFHYARYPEDYWEEELRKIRAGGVKILATYVFWMFHEEKQGQFVWSGRRDLRRFIELCGRAGLQAALRVGPFAHGEWRNGGLPDWLYGQPFEVRSNDAAYLALVERLYFEIAAQVKGLFFADGGPIIAVQLENEYMHAGAPWETIHPLGANEWAPAGRDGVAHLARLKEIAGRAGLTAPYTFITAWGGAPILEGESLPVYGDYAYPVWLDQMPLSRAYIFQDYHRQPVEQPTHRTPKVYPYLTAELQGGIQVTARSRPVVPGRSTEAMALVRLGSGANYLGYYMYHGGTTPTGTHGYSNEHVCPRLSYDFQAPLGEFGRPSESYAGLKLLHLFIDTWGQALAPLATILPAGEAPEPADSARLRWCARAANGSGFLFINNFQDHAEMQAQRGVAFTLQTPAGSLHLPHNGELEIAPGECLILPVNIDLDGALLEYATAQPLARIDGDGCAQYFFFTLPGIQPEYCFSAGQVSGVDCSDDGERLFLRPHAGLESTITFETLGGKRVALTTLTRARAETAWVGPAWGRTRAILAEGGVEFTVGGICLRRVGAACADVTVFPPIAGDVTCGGARLTRSDDAASTRLHIQWPDRPAPCTVTPAGQRKRLVEIPNQAWEGASDLFLEVDYTGDMAMAFIDGVMIADNFNNGLPWSIGLKRFRQALEGRGLCLVFQPLRQGAVKNVSSSVAARFEFEGEELLDVKDIRLVKEYTADF